MNEPTKDNILEEDSQEIIRRNSESDSDSEESRQISIFEFHDPDKEYLERNKALFEPTSFPSCRLLQKQVLNEILMPRGFHLHHNLNVKEKIF